MANPLSVESGLSLFRKAFRVHVQSGFGER